MNKKIDNKNDVWIQKTLSFLRAIGSEGRLNIILILSDAWPEGLDVNTLTKKTWIRQSNMSRHLRELRAADIVLSARRGGRHIYYSLNQEYFRMRLLDVIDHLGAVSK